MTALTRQPQNTNFLQPTKFLLTFDRITTVQYFCQSANIPGVGLGEAPLNFPGLDVFAPGNKLEYSPFNISFLVDEKLQSWQELHSWFRSIASPEGTDERNTLRALQNNGKVLKTSYSDATLTVLNNLNNPVVRVQFINCFPTSLSDINFDTKQSADDILTTDATFRYDYFNFLPV